MARLNDSPIVVEILGTSAYDDCSANMPLIHLTPTVSWISGGGPVEHQRIPLDATDSNGVQ